MDSKLSELLYEYEKACEMPMEPTEIKYLPENHIQNENRSIKWNKEYIKQNNAKYQEEVSRINKERNTAMDFVVKKIKQYIMDKAKVKQKTAQKIFEFAHLRTNGLYEMRYYIEDLIDLFLD